MKTLKSTFALLAAFVVTFNAVAQSNITPRANNVSVEIIVEEGNVQILWNTTKEINSSYFLIEKSTDSMLFTAVTMMKAAGNANFARNYTFSEPIDTLQRASYRVILVTMNGERVTSALIPVNSFEGTNINNIAAK
ncbi:MAG: hypothetical protein KBB37_02910 [Bacteroidia bacterium]|jgi:hypothetical protein|nr:hypothetical protein [Bacteroidia bacterium]MBP7260213.1 hypothetical protein [Bacteroidia bacterium]MBP9179822.1 hypothetical protein [Bacteroidia bacterium]MBP9723821.1 hypothetical protein [Bacteroidia bacterium]